MQKKYFLHICNGSEIPLMSILKLFVDDFVSFLKKGGNYYLPLNWEYIVVLYLYYLHLYLFINDNSKKEEMEKMNRWKNM